LTAETDDASHVNGLIDAEDACGLTLEIGLADKVDELFTRLPDEATATVDELLITGPTGVNEDAAGTVDLLTLTSVMVLCVVLPLLVTVLVLCQSDEAIGETITVVTGMDMEEAGVIRVAEDAVVVLVDEDLLGCADQLCQPDD